MTQPLWPMLVRVEVHRPWRRPFEDRRGTERIQGQHVGHVGGPGHGTSPAWPSQVELAKASPTSSPWGSMRSSDSAPAPSPSNRPWTSGRPCCGRRPSSWSAVSSVPPAAGASSAAAPIGYIPIVILALGIIGVFLEKPHGAYPPSRTGHSPDRLKMLGTGFQTPSRSENASFVVDAPCISVHPTVGHFP
jgi:hypothetical protein